MCVYLLVANLRERERERESVCVCVYLLVANLPKSIELVLQLFLISACFKTLKKYNNESYTCF